MKEFLTNPKSSFYKVRSPWCIIVKIGFHHLAWDIKNDGEWFSNDPGYLLESRNPRMLRRSRRVRRKVIINK